MNKLLFILISVVNICSSFQLPLRNNYIGKSKLNRNIYMFNKDSYQFHINNGVVYGNIIQCLNTYLDTDMDRKRYKYYVTFKYGNKYSIINVEYMKDINNKLRFDTYNMTELSNHNTTDKNEIIDSIWMLIDKVSKWRGRFQSINSYIKYPMSNVYDIDSYDFRYFFMDISHKKRICHLGVNNLILSVPEEIDDYKPFSIIFGCLLTPELYNQVNINYNYNGYLTSVDFYEYKPSIKVINNFMILEMLRQLFICK